MPKKRRSAPKNYCVRQTSSSTIITIPKRKKGKVASKRKKGKVATKGKKGKVATKRSKRSGRFVRG